MSVLADLPYGCQGCTCGTHATPDPNCTIHRARWLAERVQEMVQAAGAQGHRHDKAPVPPWDHPGHYDAIENAVVAVLPQAFEMTEDESEAMQGLATFMRIVTAEWKLKESDNLSVELCAAVHACQQFVIQHMLQRMGVWGEWYEDMPRRDTVDAIVGQT